ncbi:MAG: GCN5-related N-acetyltransferase [Lacrimispora sp.]|jgi:RimJ/RimL family protein N-acetyltransferase|nr:GCN5-related N-acetyltransferase [Lacrimispora sp.]
MEWEREITIEGKNFQVTISDEYEALRSAFAEGRAVIGLWDRGRADQCLSPATYLVESLSDVTPQLLERVVQRKEGLPWNITDTRRLLIREFMMSDADEIPKELDGGKDAALFCSREMLESYTRQQYGFYEYGIWALYHKDKKVIVGKSGLFNLDIGENEEFYSLIKKNDTPLELGYHIFTPYRRQGYAREACQAILTYAAASLTDSIYARVLEENQASVSLLESLGFQIIGRTHSGSASLQCLYEWNCL